MLDNDLHDDAFLESDDTGLPARVDEADALDAYSRVVSGVVDAAATAVVAIAVSARVDAPRPRSTPPTRL